MKKLKVKGHTLEFYNQVVEYFQDKYNLSYLVVSDLIYPYFEDFAKIYREEQRSKKKKKFNIVDHL